jgi:uncharacterized membrane protein YfcA
LSSSVEILSLLAGAFLAGVMNAIAGGGTIITFPLLIAFGIPAIQANATSSFALIAGIGGSLYGYRSHMHAVRPWMKIFAPVSIAGGLLGAWLLTVTSEKFFSQLVPFLILFATVLFLLSRVISRLAGFNGASAMMRHSHKFAAACVQFFVSVYGGYFGAGIGILMLAALGLIGLQNIHQMNAIKTVLGMFINLVATAYFIWAGLVVWPQALVMTVGAVAGYYSGASLSTRIPQTYVRAMIVIIGLVLSLLFFWRQFLS